MKTALIDADILRYEVGSVGQKLNKETGEVDILPFDFVKEVLDERIRIITEGSGADKAALYLTGDRTTHRIYTKRNPGGEFIPNFREALAKGKVYKGTRKAGCRPQNGTKKGRERTRPEQIRSLSASESEIAKV